METVGNEELEMEYVASKLLSGIILPSQYIDIRSLFSKIPVIDTSDSITTITQKLKVSLNSSLGLLNDSKIANFFYGKEEELKRAVEHLHNRSQVLMFMYDQAIDEKLELTYQQLENDTEGQDYVGIGQAIDTASFESDEIRRLNDIKLQLANLRGITDSLLNLYGSATAKIPSKTMDVNLTPKYKLYLLDLSNNLDKVSSNVVLSSVMGRIIDSLGKMLPQNDLDPFKLEVVNNMLDTLTAPKDYYKDCKLGEIVSADVGDVFSRCYHEFSQEFLSLYIEDYESMTYQEQINFKKCFSIPTNDSQLLQFTNAYIKLSYT